MRIIGGKYRSRRIQTPSTLKARPTTDFAKESLFNILSNKINWEEARALDLFSGTGSIALEMVSRGCPQVICVEQNPTHYNFICRAKEMLRAPELIPIKADVFKYLQNNNLKFDLIFADPPYDLTEGEKIPSLILEKDLLNNNGIFVMEHARKYTFSHLPMFLEERKYGSVHFSFFLKDKDTSQL